MRRAAIGCWILAVGYFHIGNIERGSVPAARSPHATRDKGHAGLGREGLEGREGLDIRQPTIDNH